MRLNIPVLTLAFVGLTSSAHAAVRVNPTGVNVNSNAATTVFLTFGGLSNQRPAEALWCGELIAATPDIGQKCDPATIFGRLPIRFDISSASGAGGFTDIMSIPASVVRRARQAAESGAVSSFFYVRRFVNLAGGPDEYVAVTCRMAGGGARVPFSLLDVRLRFTGDEPVLFVRPGQTPPPLMAEISYNGTGRLIGRWEIVMPGEELPETRDLLTEASLPIEDRGRQRRYTELDRFNVFLPPTGSVVLPGPDVSRLPRNVEGLHHVLLRIEASDDKEGDSSLAAAGAGSGIVHSGAVAGFPMPALRYVVGSASSAIEAAVGSGRLRLLLPAGQAALPADAPVDFSWTEVPHAVFYRIEVQRLDGQPAIGAVVQSGIAAYRAPSFLREKAGDGYLRWRVTALDAEGRPIDESGWRDCRLMPPRGQP